MVAKIHPAVYHPAPSRTKKRGSALGGADTAVETTAATLR